MLPTRSIDISAQEFLGFALLPEMQGSQRMHALNEELLLPGWAFAVGQR